MVVTGLVNLYLSLYLMDQSWIPQNSIHSFTLILTLTMSPLELNFFFYLSMLNLHGVGIQYMCLFIGATTDQKCNLYIFVPLVRRYPQCIFLKLAKLWKFTALDTFPAKVATSLSVAWPDRRLIIMLPWKRWHSRSGKVMSVIFPLKLESMGWSCEQLRLPAPLRSHDTHLKSPKDSTWATV